MTGAKATPLRILLVHERYRQYGGEDAVFDAQVRLFQQRGHPVERVEVDNDEIDERGLRSRLELAAATIWSREGIRRVRRAVEAFGPDVVHVHNTFPLLSPAIYSPVRALGPAVVQTLHNYRLVCPSGILYRDGHPCQDCIGQPLRLPGIIHRCYRDSALASATVAAMLTVHRLRRTWRTDVDAFVALAEFARERLVDGGVPRSRTYVVPNFVEDRGAAPESGGADVLFVGRLTEDKGVLTLLEAWQLADGAGGGLRIAGDGPLRERVLAAADADATVTYLGAIPPERVRAEMSAARAVVVPSEWYEVCPMTVLEALAVGRPVIATRHGALAELITDGVTGLHVRPSDPRDLARSLKTLRQDAPRARAMGTAARQAFEARFTPDIAYSSLIGVFDQARHHRRVS